MYKVYDEVNNEIVITKNKFSKFDINKYAQKVNKELADGLKQFIYHDIHSSEYIGKFVEYLKTNLARNASNEQREIIDSIRVYDSVTVDVARSGPAYSVVRCLFTWNGDERPLEAIKAAAHASLKERKNLDPWVFSGIDGFNEFSQDDYVGIAEFPTISDNCTFRLYSSGYSDTPDDEYFIKLKVDNKLGLYYNKDEAVISGPSTRIKFSKDNMEDVMNINYSSGKHPKVKIKDLLYFMFLSEGKSGLYDTIKFDIASNPFIKFSSKEKPQSEETIQKLINDGGFKLNTFTDEIINCDGIERINTIEGYIVAEDYGDIKYGTTVTKQQEEILKNNYDIIKVFCKVTPVCYTAQSVKVSLDSLLGYISKDKISKEARIDMSSKYGTLILNNIIECKIHDGYAEIPENVLLTPAVQTVIFKNGVTEIQVKEEQGDSKPYEISLTRIILTGNRTCEKIYNICSVLKAVIGKDTNVQYNILNQYINYNKIILTPEYLFKKYTLMVWYEEIKKRKDKFLQRALNKGNYIDLKLLLREYFPKERNEEQNPFNVMAKSFMRAVQHHLQIDSDYLEMIDITATTNPINFLSSITRVDLSISNARAISFDSRMISVPMLGRYDSFEVPPSHKIGATTHLTINCKIDREGNMLARYYVVKNRQITNEIKELKIIEDHNYNITSMSEVDIDNNGYITNKSKILAKVQSRTNYYGCDLAFIDPSEVQLISMSLFDELSWATSTLLFVGNNDSARVTYGCSQIKQAKSIINAEIPMVMTPTWRLIPQVQDVFTKVRANTGDRRYPLPKLYNTQHSVTCQYHSGPYHYSLSEYNDVKCSEIKLDTVALGINALVAFYPDGSTYEDAVHMSKNFAERLISYRVDSKESKPAVISVKEKVSSVEESIKSPTVAECPIVAQGDLLAESALLKVKQRYLSEEPALYINRGVSFGDSSGKNRAVSLKCDTLVMQGLQAGDKVSNRHANKGVLSATSPEELPYLMKRTDNGFERTTKQLDVVYNPFGVIARMNIGQLFEAQLGLISKVLSIKFNIEVINNDTVKELMYLTWKLVNSGDNFQSVAQEFKLGDDFIKVVTKLKPIIQSWKGIFDEKGRAYIDGSRTPVNIGYIYINRLTQESETKINARGGRLSDPSYSIINGEPAKGAKRGGGQRLGNMENDALIAYGATKQLNRFMKVYGSNLSDSFIYSQSILESSVVNGEEVINQEISDKVKSTMQKLPDIRLTSAQLIAYLLAMGFEVKSNTNNNTDYMLKITKSAYRLGLIYDYGKQDSIVKGFTNKYFSKEQLHESKVHSPRVQELLLKLKTNDFDLDTKKSEVAPNGLTWGSIIEKWAYVMDNLNDNEEEPSIYDIIHEPSVSKCDNILRLYKQKKKEKDTNKFIEPLLDVDNDPALGLIDNDKSEYLEEGE